MIFTFKEALDTLGSNAAFEIANQARVPSDYIFGQLLPERNELEYDIKSGYMIVRSTMAGLVGMDSEYPPTGFVEHSTFSEQTAKIANRATLSEQNIRKLQAMVTQLRASGQYSNEFLANEVLNFIRKVILQPHFDTAEWLRARALVNGQIDWTFNGKRLLVTYGIPAANQLAQRTSTAAYGGSASVFWADVREAKRLLRHNVRAVLAHPNTIDEVLYNDANKVEVLSQSLNAYSIRRLVGNNDRPSQDARDTLQMIAVDQEVEIFDLSNPGQTTKIPLMPEGYILFIGNNSRTEYRVGEGATDDPEADNNLGYTHIGPTVEGNGSPGRWARVYTPEREPWQLVGEGVTNLLPVIEAPEKIVRLHTEMS